MVKSGLSFKSDFNPKELERMLLSKAKELVKKDNHIPIACPNCEYKFDGHIGLNTCPNCKAKIDFTLT